MARLLLVVAVIGLAVGGARADPSNLEAGVFIAHYVPELGYTTDPPGEGWCNAYLDYAIDNCEDQNNRIDVNGYLPSTWYVLAAWYDEEKEWCGTEFGFGEYDARIFRFMEHGPCYPETGLEMPTPNWPGPNEGIACVVTGGSWTGNFVPVYWFGGYAYSYFGEGVISLGVDPPSGVSGTANCLVPCQSWEAAQLGGIGVNTEGIAACPRGPLRPCCDPVTYECYVISQPECEFIGGFWHPELDSCAPDVCQPHVCCCLDECYLVLFEQCVEMGGVFYPEWNSCDLDYNPCDPPPGAVCCLGEVCWIMSQSVCELAGGDYHPEWHSCDPNPCESTSAKSARWGFIKALYR